MNWLRDFFRQITQGFLPWKSWVGELRDKNTLRADLVAGITVALVLIPQSMAYAELAGLPPYVGLYASFLPPMVAALFGASRQLATGPVAVVSLMTAATLGPIASSSPEAYLAYAMILAILIGLIQFSLGMLRLGVIVDLLSHPVVIGFTNAGALIIATSQLGKLFGVDSVQADHHYETVYMTLLMAMEQTHYPTLIMGTIAIGIMVILKIFWPRLPNVLIAVLVTTLASWLLGYEEIGGKVVGEIPAGLPAMAMPSIDAEIVGQLLVSAFIISLIGFMEAIAIAKAMAAQTRQRLDTNQELVGQGLSNLASGISSGYPVSGSFSRSAVSINAGAVTGFSSIVTGLSVGVTLLFLTPLLYHLPYATLAAVIIVAVAKLIRISPFIHAWQAQPHDSIVAVITFCLTLYLAPNLEGGIILGIILSLLFFIMRSMRPRVAVLSRYEDGSMRDAELFNLPTSDHISVIRYDGSLYFANASYFEDKVLEEVALKPNLKFIIVEASGINQIDATGEEVLHNVAERLNANGIQVVFTGIKKQILDVIRRTRLIDYLKEDHFFRNLQPALDYVWDSLGDDYDRTNCPLRRQS